MKRFFVGAYVVAVGTASEKTESAPLWNNGEGDGPGEPFRSGEGGKYRYEVGRKWDNANSTDNASWHKYAAPYSSVNPSAPGDAAQGGSTGGFDWQQYAGSQGGQPGVGGSEVGTSGTDDVPSPPVTGGSGSAGGQQYDWQQYAGSQGGGYDWKKYVGSYGGSSDSGAATTGSNASGYFELEIEGKDLNVTTTFGLGQGRASNSTGSSENGGGGGQQASISASHGKVHLKGSFVNKFPGDDVIAA